MKETVGKVWHEMVGAVRSNIRTVNETEWPPHHLLCECRKCTPGHFKYRTKTLSKTRKKKNERAKPHDDLHAE